MPSSCCIPGCKSNYGNGDNIRTFLFPKADKNKELHDQWIKKIPRKNWTPGPRTTVCILHFKDEEVIKEDILPQKDGTILKIPRKRYKLVDNAIPSLFSNLPSYLSSPSSTNPRTDPDQRRENIRYRENEQIDNFLNEDLIPSFDKLIIVKDIIKSDWQIFVENERITYFKLKEGSVPLEILTSVTVSRSLTIKVFHEGKLIPKAEFNFLFDINVNKELCVQRYSQLENLFVFLNNITPGATGISSTSILKSLETFLKEENVHSDEENELLSCIKFFCEQLILLRKISKGRRYSPYMLA